MGICELNSKTAGRLRNGCRNSGKWMLCVAVTLAMACGAMTSCDDDDFHPDLPRWNGEFFKGTEYEKGYNTGACVTVVSEPGHKSGQKHRSSDNFSTKPLASGSEGSPKYMIVGCPDGVTFKINVDKTGTDEEWTYDVYNGALLEYRSSDKLYIADPSGANDRFTVTFTAMYPLDGNVFVSSPGRHRSGQSHRAGTNFKLPSAHMRYKVVCSDKNVKFGLYRDVTSANDDKLALEVKDGDYVTASISDYDYYITDPEGASGPFQVMFKPEVVEWVSMIDDNAFLGNVSIPGTHDTGTYKLEPLNFGFSKCQNMSITQQLEMGVRYLDLRVDGMDICHGSLSCDLSFKTVIADCDRFLEEHPGEIIVFELSDEGGNMPRKFKEYLDGEGNKYKSRFRFDDTVPYVHQARGKIVVIRRYKLPSDMSGEKWGIDFSGKNTDGKNVWPNDTKDKGKTERGVVYYIQDRFFSAGDTDDHDTHEKTDLVREAVTYAGEHPGTLVLNFVSISASAAHTPYMFVWGGTGVSPKMSDSVKDIISDFWTTYKGTKGAGWLIMDYPGNNGHDDHAHMIERIVNTNFAPGKEPFPLDLLHSSYD